ncbi:MAG: response regulator transcription factor [Bellilinea sp.]
MLTLIIDDDPAMTDLLKIQMQSTEFEVKVAYSGKEGIKSARKYNPDIIILDLLMPDMDGMETCKKIREFSQAPILILSALDQPVYIVDALNAGADDYLVKPVSSTILIAHLQKLSRRITAKKHSMSPATV